MNIFDYLEKNYDFKNIDSCNFIYNDMESQSNKILPIIYNNFDVKNKHHWADRGALWDFFYSIDSDHQAMRQKGIDSPEVQIDQIWMQVLGTENIEAARRFAIQFEMIVNPGYPMPQMTNVLSVLQNSGMRLGIISNAQFFTPLLFQVLCGDIPENIGFEAGLIFYSYQHGVAKPSRRLFQLAARALKTMGIEPENALYVGNDMLNDMLPATVEGLQTALFAGDKRSLRLREDDPRCEGVTPDLIITDLSQLIRRITPDQNLEGKP